MGETIAAALERKGRETERVSSLQSTLLRLLRKRFKKLPRKLEARINATTNVTELQTWLDNFVDARTLVDAGVPHGVRPRCREKSLSEGAAPFFDNFDPRPL